MRNDDTEAAQSYHEATKHSEWRLRSSRHVLDWDNQPLPFKIYTSLEPIPLPALRPPLEIGALEALRAAGLPAPATRVPDLVDLARVLQLSAGITRKRSFPGGSVQFRAYPNTGALYHVDLYLVCGELPGLAAGVYHFSPHDFALRRLREGDHRARIASATGHEPAVARAPALLASASTYWRNSWKYQERAWRHCFWDAGTLHANLLTVAAAEGLTPRVVLGFADAALEELLGLDPAREGALTLVPLGRSDEPPPTPPDAPPLALPTQPLSRREVDHPLIREAHASSSLASGDEAAAWRKRGASGASRAPGDEALATRGARFPLDAAALGERPPESLEHLIHRRGSTRAFDPRAAISAAELAVVIETATRRLDADFLESPAASLVDPYLIVHAVEGLPPGAYAYRRADSALELLREGDFRAEAGRLGLFQELPADACANLYFLADLDSVLARLGNRGYRAAQLEGGIRGGRAYLAAYALGFGATGLTFLDDEVIEFFSPDARGKAVMFLVALGRSLRRRKAA